MLEIKSLDKKFKNIHALKGVNAKFLRDQITGLIGYNGSGKTTIFNIIVDFLSDYSGSVKLDGKPLTLEDYHSITFLSSSGEENNNDTAKELLNFVGMMYGLKKPEINKRVKTLCQEFYFDYNLKTRMKKLSKGNRQKVKLMALFLNPNLKIMLLDEPFDGLDPIMVEKISQSILKYKKDRIIIITSHRLNVIDNLCDEFYILKEGRVVATKKDKVKEVVEIKVNKEVDIHKIKDDSVKKIVETNEHWIIELDSLDNVKNFSKHLVKDKNYKFHTLKESSLSEAVFKEYSGEQ